MYHGFLPEVVANITLVGGGAGDGRPRAILRASMLNGNHHFIGTSCGLHCTLAEALQFGSGLVSWPLNVWCTPSQNQHLQLTEEHHWNKRYQIVPLVLARAWTNMVLECQSEFIVPNQTPLWAPAVAALTLIRCSAGSKPGQCPLSVHSSSKHQHLSWWGVVPELEGLKQALGMHWGKWLNTCGKPDRTPGSCNCFPLPCS